MKFIYNVLRCMLLLGIVVIPKHISPMHLYRQPVLWFEQNRILFCFCCIPPPFHLLWSLEKNKTKCILFQTNSLYNWMLSLYIPNFFFFERLTSAIFISSRFDRFGAPLLVVSVSSSFPKFLPSLESSAIDGLFSISTSWLRYVLTSSMNFCTFPTCVLHLAQIALALLKK